MNKEIKFKAWLKEEKKMVEVKEIILYPEKQIGYDTEYRNGKSLPFHYLNYKLFEDIELLQYTGLKDKNGVEIYDGYIVERSYDLWTKNGVKKIIERAVVEFYNLKFIFNGFDSDVTIRTDMLKVIGNIYENPELV